MKFRQAFLHPYIQFLPEQACMRFAQAMTDDIIGVALESNFRWCFRIHRSNK